ncbi:MAG: hypothetical protein VX438_08750 [Planctomycetota bacterium]|nr:hypothetical protein [Planctomycetota bacterium]
MDDNLFVSFLFDPIHKDSQPLNPDQAQESVSTEPVFLLGEFLTEEVDLMQTHCNPTNELNELRRFVFTQLCDENDFELDAYQTSEQVLRRKGKPCGMLFCLHGPRSVKLTAVWETERNTVLFYHSTGERSKRIQLSEAPRLVG